MDWEAIPQFLAGGLAIGAVYGLMWLIWPVDRWYAQRVRRELGPEVAPG